MERGVGDEHLGTIAGAFACDDANARAIVAKAQPRKFAAHETMVRVGDAAPGAWLMLIGSARAVAYAPGGQFVLVHGFDAGDLFGEAVGLGLDTAEVAATGPVEAGQFGNGDFVALMETQRCVADAVARTLIRRLGETTQRMIAMSVLSAAGRIHAELLRQARLGEDLTIRPAPVLSEFALHVQSTRETVSRAISALEKRGIIVREQGTLRVVAPHRLEELIY